MPEIHSWALERGIVWVCRVLLFLTLYIISKFWPLSKSEFQLSWFSSLQFSAYSLKRHSLLPPLVLKQAHNVKYIFFQCIPRVQQPARGFWVCVPVCRLWQTSHSGSVWTHQNQIEKRHHIAASRTASSSSSSFLSYFHPLLMCGTLIEKISFLTFWSIGYTCR